MRKKILPIILTLIIAMFLTGCNVKFIEKVEPEQAKKSTEDFGSIIIDETEPSKSTQKSTQEQLEQTTESEKEIDSEIETSTEPIADGTFEYGGVKFIRDDSSPTFYCKEDCVAKISPSSSSKDYTSLKKGDFVTLKAISADNKWAMVSIYGGPTSFVEYKYLTEEEIRQEQTINPLSTETASETLSEVQSEINTQQSSTSENQQQASTSSSQASQQSPVNNTPAEDTYSGIPYPSNASSTSYNMGVEFADVTITVTVRKDGTQISNGPDKIANSTGYYCIGTLNKGDTIKCTGIGRNGYVRVEYNGQIGFIDSKNVEY